MNKLLLLALLGLGLGGGAWKAQNPDGTLEDLKTQATASADRLKSGWDAVINYPEAEAAQASLEERLLLLEQELGEDNSEALAAELQAIVDEKLSENTETLISLRETFDERVAPMEDMTVAVAALDTALQETRARTDAGAVRLDAIDRRLELLVRRLDEQTTDTQIQTLTQAVDELRGQIDTLASENDRQVAALNESLTEMQEQSSGLGLRLNTLITSANTTASANASADDTSADENIATASALSLTAGIDERFSEIEARLATVNADSRRIAALTEQLQAANAKIEQLEQQDAQSAESLQQLSSSVDELNTVSESISIDTIQAQISDQLALAQSQFESSAVNANTAQLQALLDTTRNRIQTLEQRVQGLPASSAQADDAAQTQRALQTQIADLEQRLEELTSADPALQTAVQDVKQQVEQLSAQGFVTQEELRSRTESESVEYKIYFDRNSTEITEDAARVLNSFIAQEKNRTTGVSIFGFTDRSGSAAYNQQLALQRATNVRSYLIQNGLDFTKITTLSGLGEDAAAAVLPDDAADAQQRVVVLYAAQP